MGNFFTEEQEVEIKRLCYEQYLERIRGENKKAFEAFANPDQRMPAIYIDHQTVEKDSPLDNLLRHFGIERTKR